MNLQQMQRVRHGARGVLALGVMVSIVANVLHAADNLISQAIAAWAPIALLLTIELIARVPVSRGVRTWARLIAMTVIAGIAAWVSYFHMVGVALRYGEEVGAAHLIPLTVDGLVVVAWVSLVELGGRIRTTELSAPVSTPGPVFDHPLPIGPSPEQVDKLSTPRPVVRKPPPTAKERVEKAHRRAPALTHEQLADRLKLSTKTVQRYRPKPDEPKPVNGRVPDLEGVSS